MKTFCVLISVLLVGCGSVKEGKRGPAGEAGPVSPPAVAPTPVPSMQGYYTFPDGGYMDLVQDTGGLADIMFSRLNLRNADGSLCLLTFNSALNLPVVNGKVYLSTTLTYPAVNGCKIDSNGTSLSGGNMITFLTLSRSATGLSVRVQTSQSNGVGVAFDHTLVSQ